MFNKEILGYSEDSRYEDCRINAYSPFTDYHGINRTPISFLMVDLTKGFGGREGSKREKLLEKGFKLSRRES